MTAYEHAIDYATRGGSLAGRDAAAWYVQDTLGRARPGADTATARTILRGIDASDPAILDTFPCADLSGEWADTLTGPQLYRDAYALTRDDRIGEDFTCICDAYESAFAAAAEDAIAAACRDVLS